MYLMELNVTTAINWARGSHPLPLIYGSLSLLWKEYSGILHGKAGVLQGIQAFLQSRKKK